MRGRLALLLTGLAIARVARRYRGDHQHHPGLVTGAPTTRARRAAQLEGRPLIQSFRSAAVPVNGGADMRR